MTVVGSLEATLALASERKSVEPELRNVEDTLLDVDEEVSSLEAKVVSEIIAVSVFESDVASFCPAVVESELCKDCDIPSLVTRCSVLSVEPGIITVMGFSVDNELAGNDDFCEFFFTDSETEAI